MENLQIILTFVSGVIIAPITEGLKNILPANAPVKPVLVSAILTILACWGLSKLLGVNMPMMDIILMGLAGQTAAQLTHAVVIKKK